MPDWLIFTQLLQVLDNLSPPIRRKCISTLYDICDRQALLPRSLEIPLPRDPNDPPLYHGGVADIWKGLYDGQEVAVKALRVYSVSELHVLRRVGSPSFCAYQPLTVACIEVLQGGYDMESPSPPECTPAVGSHDIRDPVCDGIRVDGKWEYSHVR